MDEERARILQKQLDTMAGRVKQLGEQMNTLVEALLRTGAGGTLQLTAGDLADLRYPKSAVMGAHQHEMEREKQLRQAAREAELDRLIEEREERERSNR